MALALESVVKQLTDSGIIAPGKLENFVPPKAAPKDGEELLRELYKKGLLTKFQAQQVAANKIKALVLGEYTIVDRIGAGGMGQVFKGEHRRMKRSVAIKTLPAATMKDEAAVARFQREVEAAAKLRHPNIVAADDAGYAGGLHFLVMEYVEGQDLSALVKKDGPLSVSKAVNYILQAARGLEFAHGEGVVHRDIKPANLLLDKKGVVKILDMGLARISGDGNAAVQAELTGTGAVMGTVDYMAPEQGLSTKHADARADIYSLGCSLHYLLIAKPTFDGESITAKLLAHHNSPPPNLCDLRSDMPTQLQAVFAKMVAKKLEDRYQSMTAVIADLESCQAGLSGKALAAGESGVTPGSATVKTSSSPDTHTSEMTLAFGGRLLHAIPAVERYVEPESKGPPWKNTKLLIGAAGFLFLLLGVWVIIRDKDGKEVTRVEVPEGGTATVEMKPSPTNAAAPETTRPATPAVAATPPAVRWPLAPSKPEDIQWLHDTLKATLTLRSGPDKEVVVKDYAPVPTAPATIVGIDTHRNVGPQMTDEALARLATLTDLESLRCDLGSPGAATKVGMAQLPKLAELRSLHLGRMGTADTDYSFLERLPRLEKLGLFVLPFPNWVDHVKRMPRLRDLAIHQLDLSRLSELKDCRQLTELSVGGTALPVRRKLAADLAKVMPWLRITLPDIKTEIIEPTAPGATGSASAPPLAKAPFDATQAKAHQAAWAKHLGTTVESKNSVGMSLVLIPPGEFLMGSTDEQGAAALKAAEEVMTEQGTKDRIQNAERPQHRVVISKPLLIGSTELTIGQFKQFIEASKYVTEAEKAVAKDAGRGLTWRAPGYPVSDDSPVTVVTWNDAAAFCNWLSEQQGLKRCYETDGGTSRASVPGNGYRLPKEAEWEYACRAGTTTQYAFGDDYQELAQYGWFKTNSGDRAQPVGKKLPNAFGLFDMHGNVCEWCEDYWDEQWYGKARPNSPSGPPAGSDHGVRSGCWANTPSSCRSAFRFVPAGRHGSRIGFRIVRTLDDAADSRLATGTATAQPNQPWNTLAFQAWVKEVQAMPAEKQIEAVSKKLMELNPGFDGKVAGVKEQSTPNIISGVLTGLRISSDDITDISPVRALVALKELQLVGKSNSKLSDLSPLRGMLLTSLGCWRSQVSDLSPLRGMSLTILNCSRTQVSDLSPLQGMPLAELKCSESQISDLSPLQGMSLVEIGFTPKNITKGLDLIRQMNTLKTISVGEKDKDKLPPDEFWKKYDAGEFGKPAVANQPWNTPAFQGWMKEVQTMPAKKQVDAVVKKLMELNPGFDGKVAGVKEQSTPNIISGVLTGLRISSDDITDISPVRALVALKELQLVGKSNSKLSDLSPLRGMLLTNLGCWRSQVSDLSPLRGMSLTILNCSRTQVSDLSPLQGMPLAELKCSESQISDLSPLQGISLVEIGITPKNITKGLDLIRQMKTLKTISVGEKVKDKFPPDEFWKKYDAGEFGKPAVANQPWNAPAFQAWMKEVQAMPAEEQIKAVSKKLMELNPGFDGKLTGVGGKGLPAVQNGMVTILTIIPDDIKDLSPLRVWMELKILDCRGNLGKETLSDLSPLQGMRLTHFTLAYTKVTDLSPLAGMPLTWLNADIKPTDLSFLRGMPLKSLYFSPYWSDLSPLRGMPLEHLYCWNSQVSDLSPLEECKSLKLLNVTRTKVSAASVAALQKALPNCKIDWDDPAKPKTAEPAASGTK